MGIVDLFRRNTHAISFTETLACRQRSILRRSSSESCL